MFISFTLLCCWLSDIEDCTAWSRSRQECVFVESAR